MGTRTSIEHPAPEQDLDAIVGHRLIYTYANGWQYEMYVKNATTIDYRIHTGMVGGRWVKDQEVDLVGLGRGVFKVSWNEPTGTSVVVNIVPEDRVLRRFRDEGPTYPVYVVPEFAHITLFEHVGTDDETVIDTAPGDLPPGFADRSN
jgi:phenolic acid decarboxylase